MCKCKNFIKIFPDLPVTTCSLSINLSNMIYSRIEKSLNVLKPKLWTAIFWWKITNRRNQPKKSFKHISKWVSWSANRLNDCLTDCMRALITGKKYKINWQSYVMWLQLICIQLKCFWVPYKMRPKIQWHESNARWLKTKFTTTCQQKERRWKRN